MKIRFENLVIFLLCFIIIIPTQAIAQPSSCIDIQNHWAYEQINEWITRGFISGYPDGTFRPSDNISRAEFYTLLNKAFDTTGLKEFEVNQTDWYNNIFLNEDINRQEVALTLSKILELDALLDYDNPNLFLDSDNIPIINRGAIGAIVRHGYMRGYPDGSFKPLRTITRAETVLVLNNVLKSLESVVILEEAQEYYLGNHLGSVVITGSNVLLKNTKVNGNLTILITGDGEVYLENVDVRGSTTINGDGDNDVNIHDCDLNNVIVDKGNQTNIQATGNTIINDILLKSGAKLEEIDAKIGFLNVTIDKTTPKGTKFEFYGDFKSVILSAERITLLLKKGSIEDLIITEDGTSSTITLSKGTVVGTLIIDSKVVVKGTGKIKKAIINVNGVKIEQNPDEVELRRRITADIGKEEDRDRMPRIDKDDDDPPHIDNPPPIDDPPPIDNYTAIVDEVKNDLELSVQNPVGRNKTPMIHLPNTDNNEYQTLITWESNNGEFISLENNPAIIYRRGSDTEGHTDGDDCDSHTAEITFFRSSVDTGPEECGGSGGKHEVVTLTATIEKGLSSTIKTFDVVIPWGWGKAITIGYEKDSCDDSHDDDSAPSDNDMDDLTLYIGQYPLILTAEDLATNGKTVTQAVYEAVYESEGSVDIDILNDGYLKITPIQVGDIVITANIENDLDDIDVSFGVTISEPAVVVDDKDAVSEAADNLNLSLYTKGKEKNQVNKIIFPSTDMVGYNTSIEWTNDNEEFIEIDGDEAIINRRGSDTDHGGCGDESHTLALSSISILHDDGDEGEDCGGSNSNGKSNIINITATISRGNEEENKYFTVTIPWGWGRDIVVE